jgi:hypothetical protein
MFRKIRGERKANIGKKEAITNKKKGIEWTYLYIFFLIHNNLQAELYPSHEYFYINYDVIYAHAYTRTTCTTA